MKTKDMKRLINKHGLANVIGAIIESLSDTSLDEPDLEETDACRSDMKSCLESALQNYYIHHRNK